MSARTMHHDDIAVRSAMQVAFNAISPRIKCCLEAYHSVFGVLAQQATVTDDQR